MLYPDRWTLDSSLYIFTSLPESCPTHLASDCRRRLLDHSTPATGPSAQWSPGSDLHALSLMPQAFPAHVATLLHHSPCRDVTRKRLIGLHLGFNKLNPDQIKFYLIPLLIKTKSRKWTCLEANKEKDFKSLLLSFFAFNDMQEIWKQFFWSSHFLRTR